MTLTRSLTYIRLRLLVLLTASLFLVVGTTASDALAASGKVTTVSGGMVPAGQEDQGSVGVAALPSCRSIRYNGNSGYISVQTSNSRVVAWGIVMNPYELSRGRWSASTFLDGKKTSSGFNRTTTTSYTPHGSIQARSGQKFTVSATLVSAVNGQTYRSVTNGCIVP